MSRNVARLPTEDTDARLDNDYAGNELVDLVLYEIDGDACVLSGTRSSLLMLVDRINDRVHTLREGLNS